ncbi:hypothetical protein M2459_001972 [Parabacteroides sp. PF5-5]|uniref:hypothetical protein n=1 Tax=unclassified Parabacteroides TaxID=2649774 RepID=UPI00247515F5|nr:MULTISPECIES: hypothetical protein [unclassified Parabacteroides]MDH6306738.1 hypothetical protein [Parabacteroides sp. PH5-39]MDH6317906.1 hypothetical protein [Parabacteroides sp. PF5-13]MDH6321410.1 hypothetical protein [Parabacteroides sp. PH5-13]MDH6325141.1 hypothetical protein [Parabacteroides sp. PH5-8]MDH6327420.1 hypothetical protein [Parabacteroides sp. PH5-41]
MGEDSQYKGELWTQQAIALLNLLSWEKIGDSGMDVEGTDNVEYGIDCLYSIKNPAKDIPESLIIEAKCYLTTSLSQSALQAWVDRLNLKISTLRGSKELFDRHPIFQEISDLKIGIIFIWFSNTDEYKSFRPRFREMVENITVSTKPLKSSIFNKIYIIDNDLISKLCSIHSVIKDFNEFKFYYPSSFINNRAVQRTSILSLDYIFSKFILGQSKDNSGAELNIVFYFGELNTQSFRLLKSVLLSFLFIDESRKLIIYKYHRDEEFRKIEPDIIKLYKEDNIDFEIKDMDSCRELPAFITNIK